MKASFNGLVIGFATKQKKAALRILNEGKLVPNTTPEELEFDYKDIVNRENWQEYYQPKRSTRVYWYRNDVSIRIHQSPPSIVIANLHWKVETHFILSTLAQLPFTMASFPSRYKEWLDDDFEELKVRVDMGVQGLLGWGCAFKGEGHNRLVSRRWLDHGPWYVQRGPNDTSIVYMHDLQADYRTAFEQATAGHKAMDSFHGGGFLQRPYPATHQLKGLYTPSTKTFRVIVEGRKVSRNEMNSACALRMPPLREEEYALYTRLGIPVYEHRVGPEQPVEKVAYIFIREEEAREHLHDLWLRELECWTFINGLEVRIDDTYEPPPTPKPAWVQDFARRIEAEQESPS